MGKALRQPLPAEGLSHARGPVDPWTRGAVLPMGPVDGAPPQRPATRRIIDSDIVRTIIIPLEVAHG